MRDMSVRKMPMRESARRGRIASSGSSRIVRVTFTVIGSSFLMTIRPSTAVIAMESRSTFHQREFSS